MGPTSKTDPLTWSCVVVQTKTGSSTWSRVTKPVSTRFWTNINKYLETTLVQYLVFVWRSYRAGNTDQLGEIWVISGTLILFGHHMYQGYCVLVSLHVRMGTGRAFHKTGQAMEKALDPGLVFIRITQNIFQFVGRRYFEHFGGTSKSVR